MMKAQGFLKLAIFFIALIFSYQENLNAGFFDFFKRYEKKKPVDAIKELEDQLVNDPKNPQLNYNLGVAQYELGRFVDAKHNFERAALYGEKAAFKELAYFNFATCLYKNTLEMLPKDWELPETEINPFILDSAIGEITNSIKQYEAVLAINEKNEKATTNKKEAEKLLKKLMKKKQQQDKDKQDKDKQDKDKQDKDKQDKDKQDQNKKQSDNDQKKDQSQQDKKDQQDQQEEKSDQQKNEQDKSQADKKDSSKKQEKNKTNKDQSDSQEKSEQDDNQSQEEDKKDNQKQRRKQDSTRDKNERKDSREQRPENKNDTEQDKEKVDHSEHNKKEEHQAQPTPAQPTEADNEKQEKDDAQSIRTGAPSQEDSTEKRAYRAILDNLDTDESKLQKHLIMQKTKGQKPPAGNIQKPW